MNRPIIITLVALVGLSCSKDIADRPMQNQTPRTQLWLYPDSTVGVSVSRQRIRWFGEDPDGLVRGYLFAFASLGPNVAHVPSPDTLRYNWLTANDTLLAFPLDTLFRYYTVFVRAVDNTFQGFPGHAIVRMHPSPYWDKNDNGVFDADDEALTTLIGAVDPVGAVLTFPIRNTPPVIEVGRDPNDPTRALKQPDTTYTVATFSWNGSDDDGENTLASYRIALNDTSDPLRWLTIPVRDTIVTLVVPRGRSDTAGVAVAADVYGGKFLGRQFLGTVSGLRLDALNILYVQVVDVAGEYSPALRIPAAANHWFVRRPRGQVMLVSDYVRSDSLTAVSTYRSALAGVPGGGFAEVDQLNIGRGVTLEGKKEGKIGVLVHPYVDPAMVFTFLLYDYVIWYSEPNGIPSLGVAQSTLFTYMQNGGKVVFSTAFENTVDPRGALRDFAPIDSVSSAPFTPRPALGDTRVPANYRVLPDSSISSNIYPLLAFDASVAFHVVNMRPIYRRSDAKYIYRLQADSTNFPNPRYIGEPNVAVVDGQRQIVFIGLPLHLMDNRVQGNPAGLTAFFTKVLTEEMDANIKVDRQRF